MSSSPQNKRKRDGTDADGHRKIKLVHTDSPAVPILATTPGITLPSETVLNAYSRPRPSKKHAPLGADFLVHGEHPWIEYTGEQTAEDVDTRHYIGVYDPSTGKVEVYPAPKVTLRRNIKALKSKVIPDHKQLRTFNEQKTALGTEFGTKKAKKVINQREMNKLDLSGMSADLSGNIASTVQSNTKHMPTREELEQSMKDARLVPEPNPEAQTPAEVYNLNEVVTPAELSEINVQKWYAAVANGEAPRAMSSNRQDHVVARIPLFATKKSTANTRKLQLLRYIEIMIDLYRFAGRGKNFRREDAKKVLRTDGIVLDGLLERYCKREVGAGKGGEDAYTLEGALRNKLLNYLAIACLHIHECRDMDTFLLKNDLGMMQREINAVFKGIGCKVKDISKAAAEHFGYSRVDAKQHKLVDLPLKPVIPNPPMRRR